VKPGDEVIAPAMTFLATVAAIEYAGATPVIEDAAQAHGSIPQRSPLRCNGCRSPRDWGQEGKGNHANPGFNYRMDGLQGAVLGIKLKHLNEWTEARNRVATLYRELLEGEERITPFRV
jgi:dTDP-4-amino-4,6-dideoxygalactose transaminase